jgi:hypothetical protein
MDDQNSDRTAPSNNDRDTRAFLSLATRFLKKSPPKFQHQLQFAQPDIHSIGDDRTLIVFGLDGTLCDRGDSVVWDNCMCFNLSENVRARYTVGFLFPYC